MANRENLKLDALAAWAWEYATTEMIKGPRRILSSKTIKFVAALSVHTLLLRLWYLGEISLTEKDRIYPTVRYLVWTKLEQEYGKA